MNEETTKALTNLAKMFGSDRVLTSQEIDKVLNGILKMLLENKKETEALNVETKAQVEKLLNKFLDKYAVFVEDMKTLEGDVSDIQSGMLKKVENKISEVTYLLEEAKKINVKEEKLEIDDIVQAVLENITLPETKEMLEITGERMIDLINETEDSEENKISWKKIKDIPDFFTTPQTKKSKLGKGGMSPTVLRQAVDLDHTTRADGYAIVWDETTQKHKYVANSGGGGSGSGTVNSGTQYRLAYYATTGTAVSQAGAITGSRVLVSDTNGVPTHSSVTTTVLGYLDATSSIQTQLNAKQGTITTGTTSQYFRGDLSLATFPTALSSFTNDSGYITASSTTTFTNKSISGSTNTISNLDTTMFATNIIDTDSTLAANSDTRISSQKAVKSYVDNALTGLFWKPAVRVATTTNGTLATAFANGQTVDGVTLATGDRILLKNQTTATENGIYVVASSGAPSRASDSDTGTELISATVFVKEGTSNADTQWTCTNNSITIGSTNIVFAQVSGAGTYSAGTGLSLSGNQFSIDSTVATLTGSQAFTNKTYNGLTVSTTTGTLTISNGKTLTASASITLAGTDGSSLSLAGNLTTSGANAITLTTSGATNVTLPTTGTLATLAGTETFTNKTLTNPTINGAVVTGDFQTDGLPDTDDTWTGKSTNSFNAAGTIAQFDCVYMTSSSTWALTDADAIGTAGNVLVMMAGAAGTASNPLRVIEPGSWVRNDAWNWTVGGTLYLDTTTPGGMTQTAPSGADDVVKVVGYAVSADVIYFAPSVNWIIHT